MPNISLQAQWWSKPQMKNIPLEVDKPRRKANVE